MQRNTGGYNLEYSNSFIDMTGIGNEMVIYSSTIVCYETEILLNMVFRNNTIYS
jgi:hypothetical protein